MILAYLQIPVNYDNIKRLLKTRYFGTSFTEIENLRRIGITVLVSESSLDWLQENFEIGLPAIVAVHTSHLKSYWKQEVGHAFVAVGLDKENIYVNDPAIPEAPRAINLNEFIPAWDEKDNLCAVISLE